MNENLNLVEILKDCPVGTKLYSTVFGEVVLESIGIGTFPIVVSYLDENNLKTETDFMADGRFYDMLDGECVLFPSKEQRVWSKFKVNKPKFNPNTLQAFDRVLAFDNIDKVWSCDFYSHKVNEQECFNPEFPYICVGNTTDRIIPYNDDTKHLVGTTDEAPEYYRYWEE